MTIQLIREFICVEKQYDKLYSDIFFKIKSIISKMGFMNYYLREFIVDEDFILAYITRNDDSEREEIRISMETFLNGELL